MSPFQSFLRGVFGVPISTPTTMSIKPLVAPALRPRPPTKPTGPSRKIRCADMLSFVVFAERTKTLAPFSSAYDAQVVSAVENIPEAINDIGGSTNLTAGLRAAIDLLTTMPRGLLRRIWLLTDGEDNIDSDRLFDEVERARAFHINVNTIGFGDPANFNESRLREIARRTHNGRYLPVATAQMLGHVLRSKPTRPTAVHHGEATVYVIDGSGSMLDLMGSKRKIEVVRDTLRELLVYKQKMFS